MEKTDVNGHAIRHVMRVSAIFTSAAAVPWLVYARTGWWLNSTAGVTAMAWSLLLLSFNVGLALPPSTWTAAGTIWTGAMVGSVSVLMTDGPGTIWPIVIVAAGVLTASAVSVGTGLGRWVRMLALASVQE